MYTEFPIVNNGCVVFFFLYVICPLLIWTQPLSYRKIAILCNTIWYTDMQAKWPIAIVDATWTGERGGQTPSDQSREISDSPTSQRGNTRQGKAGCGIHAAMQLEGPESDRFPDPNQHLEASWRKLHGTTMIPASPPLPGTNRKPKATKAINEHCHDSVWEHLHRIGKLFANPDHSD